MESSGTEIEIKTQHMEIVARDNESIFDLEGELKIQSTTGLKINWVRSIILIIPVALSLIGLLLLKSYKWLRVLIFFDECSLEDADYIYIEGTDGIDAISRINYLEQTENPQKRYFFFQKLKYELLSGKPVPIGFRMHTQYRSLFDESHYSRGIDEDVRSKFSSIFGKNEHLVDSPMYFEYIFDVMTKPFFIMQYLTCVVMILQKYEEFGALMIGMALFTTSINYIFLYYNFRKIKQMAEKTCEVEVLRDGRFEPIQSSQIVPGDIFKPKADIVCDAILVKGEIYLNESSLTGESLPIGKFPVTNKSQLTEKSRWLFEGSTVLECRTNTLAMAVHTGYCTHRGRTIRKIMNRHTREPDFFITGIYFFIECWVVATIIYVVTLPIILNIDITTEFMIYKYMDFVGWSVPPIFPILFNLAYSFSLARLGFKKIYGNEPQKTVESAKMKIMCFDKTGTLTENELEIHQVIKFDNQQS